MADHEPTKPHRWQAGQASPNPRGRPPTSKSIAAALRAKLSSDEFAAIVVGLITDPETPARERLAALALYANRVEPPVSKHLVGRVDLPLPMPALAHLSADERVAAIDEWRRRALALRQPDVIDVLQETSDATE